MGLFDKIGVFKRAVWMNPNDAKSNWCLGVAYGDAGRWADAIEPFKQAIRIDSNCADAYYGLGLAYGHLSRWDDAVDANRQAISVKPGFAEAYYSLGVAYGSLDRWEEAVAVFEKAIQFKPNYNEALHNIVVAKNKVKGNIQKDTRERASHDISPEIYESNHDSEEGYIEYRCYACGLRSRSPHKDGDVFITCQHPNCNTSLKYDFVIQYQRDVSLAVDENLVNAKRKENLEIRQMDVTISIFSLALWGQLRSFFHRHGYVSDMAARLAGAVSNELFFVKQSENNRDLGSMREALLKLSELDDFTREVYTHTIRTYISMLGASGRITAEKMTSMFDRCLSFGIYCGVKYPADPKTDVIGLIRKFCKKVTGLSFDEEFEKQMKKITNK